MQTRDHCLLPLPHPFSFRMLKQRKGAKLSGCGSAGVREGEKAEQRKIDTSTSTPISIENGETDRGSEIEWVRECGSERKRDGVKKRKWERGRRIIHCKMGGKWSE